MIKKEIKKKVVVGLSGGVDSSVALYLLKKQGYDVVGVSLKFGVWENEKNLIKENVCCNAGAFLIAKNVCNFFDVPYMIKDVKDDFLKKVIKYWVNELKTYNTPNPCIMCNHLVKIQALIDVAKELGADYVATGHYAQNVFNRKTKEFELKTAKDMIKDQTYFLSRLDQKQLQYLKLPLAKEKKENVYKIAKRLGFKVFQKIKQSQDFCFVANKSYNDFLLDTLGEKPGKIVDMNNKIIGKHMGLYFYTIGQRKGIDVSNGPYYVVDFDIKKNTLIVSKNQKDLLDKKFKIDKLHLINSYKGDRIDKKIKVQIRFKDTKEIGWIVNKKEIVLRKVKRAITPGQFAVFYDKNRCIGNGTIKKDK